ncbi:conserved membrane protein of unknown function [Tenacibaculum sp. 190130A14a]|uniref:Beta-carotene 15,15'-monooxygenase n=1 Tax=Tenacibaculum polynesiense TaxID=3137857 RepID=A0ABM9PE49_9FLAO
MLANFFGKSKPINFLVIFGLFLCYFVVIAFSKELTIETFKELAWFLIIFSVFNFIIAKNQLTFDNSYAYLFYVILIGFFAEVIQLNYLLYANVTVLLFLRKVYSLQSSKNILHKLFDGGLWLGVSFLIEPYTILFILLLYISTFLHQRFTYQTLFTPVLGFFAPVFLYFTYCLWYDKTEDFTNLFLWYSEYDFQFYFSNKYLIPMLFIGFCTFFTLVLKTPKTLAVKNLFRRNWIIVLFHLLLAGIIIILINERNVSELLFAFFPTAIILANGLELVKKKLLAEIILVAFLLLSFMHFFF